MELQNKTRGRREIKEATKLAGFSRGSLLQERRGAVGGGVLKFGHAFGVGTSAGGREGKKDEELAGEKWKVERMACTPFFYSSCRPFVSD